MICESLLNNSIQIRLTSYILHSNNQRDELFLSHYLDYILLKISDSIEIVFLSLRDFIKDIFLCYSIMTSLCLFIYENKLS